MRFLYYKPTSRWLGAGRGENRMTYCLVNFIGLDQDWQFRDIGTLMKVKVNISHLYRLYLRI